jgi:predicted ATPase
MRNDLPSGTVTFLFTDVEGSTKLLHSLGAEAYADALAEHRRVIRDACAAEGGVEVDTQGDAFFFAFPTARGAVAAAAWFTQALAPGPVHVRVGLHTGTPHLTEEGYVGHDVHKGARIAAVGHGGQALLSFEAREQVEFEVSDLGEHRLKDFAEPVWIFQLGSERFPPLKTISNTNLPRPASSFIGREREVAQALDFLRGGARLLTLTGPGGSGKTRLAIEAAAELVSEYRNGVFWVGLAALRDPTLVSETIAQTLGAKDGLAEHIGERELLLLLDNFEHVVEAAPILPSLISACPSLRLLVTSRELLRVQGEVEYPVPPLAAPEAVALFCERAQVAPTEEVAELCIGLDSLPLAVELAAARTSVLSTAQILERLGERLDLLKGGRDADPRQATLRATIEWSYELLTAEEQRLFARLSVFAGGCTLEVAQEICDADLDTLQSLVEKSLLRFSNERYWMLETLREYAIERLEASGETDVFSGRHAEHFLVLAEQAYPNLRGTPQERAWLDRLESEHDNLRAALDRFEEAGDVQLALQLAGALYRFWYLRGHAREGFDRLERLLLNDHEPTRRRARALTGAAAMALSAGDTQKARLLAKEGVSLNREVGDIWGATYATYLRGTSAAHAGEFEKALPFFEEALEGFHGLGDDHYVLSAMDALAWVTGTLGDHERRKSLHEEVLRLAREQSNERIAALQLGQLALFASRAGDIHVALSMLEETYRIYRDAGIHAAVADVVGDFALALTNAGYAVSAAQVISCADALHEEYGTFGGWTAKATEEILASIHAELDDAAFEEAWERGRRLTADEAVALAFDDVD